MLKVKITFSVFFAGVLFSSFAQSQSKLASEMISTTNGQKFFEIGACYSVAMKAVEVGNPNLTENVKRLIVANPDLASLRRAADDIATNKCGLKRTESCMRSIPVGALAFLMGEDKSKTIIQNVNNPNQLQKDLAETCGKNFKY
jgi:hypothetical protein